MKKLILILIFGILLICGLLNAQDWNTLGNSGTSPTTNYVGTSDNTDLSFGTYGSIKMQLESTGELGLGTTSPASWFHIAPSGSNESFRTVSSSTSTADAWKMFRGSQEMARMWFGSSANAFTIHSTRGAFHISSGSTGGADNKAVEIIGGNGADAGYMGLGDWTVFTAVANVHVHENSATTSSMQLTNSTTGYNNNDGGRWELSSEGKITFNNYEDNDISFGTGGGSGLTERLIVKGATNYGRVGVGITTPATQLEVWDQTDLSGAGDDIAFRATEILNTSNTTNRAIAQELRADNGYQTLGINLTVDNNTTGTGRKMYGIWNAVRHTNSSNVDDAEGMHVDLDYDDNYAVRKTGIKCEVGNQDADLTNTANTWGGHFFANSGYGNNIGGYFEATSSSNGNSYGIWAKAPDQTCAGGGTLGSPVSCSGAAGYFEGEVWASGDIYSFSDASLKDNITPIQNASSLLAQFAPKQYTFNHQVHPNMPLPYGTHYGFMAQDVLTIAPELVADLNHPAEFDSSGNILYPAFNTLGLNYTGIIPLLVAAVNEQKTTIDSLLNALQNPNPTPVTNPINHQKVTLSNVSSIILNQNDPNPFIESTRITYQIPDDVKEAKVIFTNSNGVVINSVVINERGTGELEVFASDLSRGIYNYTLVCDGKIISTKKMVKQ